MGKRNESNVPSPEEQRGMNWWNQLTEDARAHWLQIAGSAIPAEAWAAYQRDGCLKNTPFAHRKLS